MVTNREIRTKAWFEQIKIDGKFSNPSQVGSFMANHPVWCKDDLDGKDRSRIWSYYSKHEKLPTPFTLKQTEKIFEGTLKTFDKGPQNSSLFTAMFNELPKEPYSNNFYTDFGWVLTIASEVDNLGNHCYSNTIEVLTSMIETDSLTEGHPEITPNNTLNFLAACILCFRHVIEYANSNEQDISNAFHLVHSSLKYKPIKLDLKKYCLYKDLQMWLSHQIQNTLEDIRRVTPSEVIEISFTQNPSKNLEYIDQVLEESHHFWEWINEGYTKIEPDLDMYGLNEKLQN